MRAQIAMSLFAAGSVLAMAGQAQAARWIVENPTQPPSAFRGDATVVKTFDLGGTRYAVMETKTPPSSFAVTAERTSLEASLGAKSVTPDFRIGPADATGESTPVAEGTPAWHVERLEYPELDDSARGQDVVVAVLDTGVAIEHEALADQIWVNEDEIPDNGIDDDGNGYVDDVNGYSFARDSGDVSDQQTHGTHCAGLVGANSRSRDPFAPKGVAPAVTVMPIHIIIGEAETFLSDAAEGIKYAVDNGATVLSNSWRIYDSWSQYEPTEENVQMRSDAIGYAEENGAVFVAAAGNESRDLGQSDDPIYPVGLSGHPLMVGVASSNESDDPSSFTNYGPGLVQVAAPGSSILSTIPDGWGRKSGTSMATPIVAGAVARGLSDGLTPREAVDSLVTTSEAVDAWDGQVESRGIIDLMEYL